MECIEARALKASFLSQMAMKSKSQVYCNDDVWCLKGINGAGSEEFQVEELLNLDFSDKEFHDGGVFEEGEGLKKHGGGCNNSSSSTFSGADEFDSLSTGQLTLPIEGLESLEWLSQFVEDDSSPGLSLMCPTGSFTSGESINDSPAKIALIDALVPRKRRSKRTRSNGVPWSSLSPPLSSVDSSTASSSSHGSSSLPTFVYPHPPPDRDWFYSAEKPLPQKKPKRKPESESGGRRCTHCLVQKTPQWRTGPLGPKTLCNACGVRFKSGRLFPEYRPACSPTFSQKVHSNSHRKVLEMRRRKELAGEVDSCDALAPPVLVVGAAD